MKPKEWKIPLKILRKDIRERINRSGAYELEYIFGEKCDGHGAGFGGEDISFTMRGYRLDFSLNSRTLSVRQSLKDYDEEAEEFHQIETTRTMKMYLTDRLIRRRPRKTAKTT